MWLAFISACLGSLYRPLHQLCQVINGEFLLFPWNIKNLYYNSNKLSEKAKQLKSGPNVHYITFKSHKPSGTDIIEK